MGRRQRIASVLAVVGVAALAADVQAQPRDRDRPIRVGNTNVAFAGYGYGSHDHPTFDANSFVNLAYQRRILRREIRALPVWVRGAINFVSEERNTDNTYTYWNDPDAGNLANVETVQERTSDFAVRLEVLADLLHTRTSALYAGGGFAVHSVSFRSRGLSSGVGGAAGLKTRDNPMAVSAVLGGRLFMARQPYTVYAEARFGNAYGRSQGTQDLPPATRSAPSVGSFDLDSAASFSFEGGVALHW